MAQQHLSWFRVIAARLVAWLLFRGPVVVDAGRHRLLFDPASGRLMPVVAGGSPDDDPEEDDDKTGSGDDDDDPTGKAAEDDDPGKDPDKDAPPSDDADADEWKAFARKWESRAKRRNRRGSGESPALKREREAREKAESALKERDDADRSEQEKAIDKAREETRAEVSTEAQKERREDRLDLEVTRLAAKGVTVEAEDEDGKTVERTVRFADPEDALAHLQRLIRRGDIDGEGLFDDKDKVQKEALAEALTELIEERPHLAAKEAGSNGGGGKKAPRPKGGADGGKGDGGGKGIEDMSVEEHVARMAKAGK